MVSEFHEIILLESDQEETGPKASKRKGEKLESRQEKKACHDCALGSPTETINRLDKGNELNSEGKPLKRRTGKEIVLILQIEAVF